MSISLVANVPYKLVIRCVIDVVKCYGKLNHTKARSEMPAMYADHVNNILPQLISYKLELVAGIFLQISWGFNLLQ